ncbi:hypothetical protein DFJ67_6754 [Asanoa ferruginea]|uniref:Uncharacterized protein n=1 Tax=Asanoa ferruginea TaxID=53367 RepID=A0A3D9ZU57_9ACTN|nr:hypothetical protein [Asanoa ferruginea]REG00698.1 hypothetical protein DFJ67_6754 [Asanoa ferruginea]
MTTAAQPIELRWDKGDSAVTWTYGRDTITKRYPTAPSSVIAWPDPPSIIVVEANVRQDSRLDNAAVLNPDGTERLRLRPPDVVRELHHRIGFYVVYADPCGLVAVFATHVGDFWGRPDLRTGELDHVAASR